MRCSSCARWHHRRCTTLTVAALGRMARSGEPWTCETCNRVMSRLDASPTSPATVAIAQGSTDRTVRRSPPRGRATRPSATQRRPTETPESTPDRRGAQPPPVAWTTASAARPNQRYHSLGFVPRSWVIVVDIGILGFEPKSWDIGIVLGI